MCHKNSTPVHMGYLDCKELLILDRNPVKNKNASISEKEKRDWGNLGETLIDSPPPLCFNEKTKKEGSGKCHCH